MAARYEVYEAIDGERNYQDIRWKEFDDSEWSIGDWLIFIERYMSKAKDKIGYDEEALHEIRKIAALAVACMEYNGAPKRS